MRTLRTVGLYLVLTLCSAVLVWLVMTETQRESLLTFIGTHSPVDTSVLPAVIGVRRDMPTDSERSPAAGKTAYGLPERVCRDWSRPTSDVARDPIYRWVDANGQAAFGDSPPAGVGAVPVRDRYAPNEQFVRARFEDRGRQFGPQLQSSFSADAGGIARILRYELGLPVRQVDVTLTLEPSTKSLNSRSAPMSHVAGLYRHGARAIVVKEQATLAMTAAVARHEASHAMLAALYGPTPPWINEGLAEIAAALQVQGQARSLTVDQSHANALQRAARSQFNAGSLAELLALDADSWKRTHSTKSYGAAWSLVHLLMETRAGRGVLSAVLAAQAAAPCKAIDSYAIVDKTWPGGARHLERAWRARLASGTWQDVSF